MEMSIGTNIGNNIGSIIQLIISDTTVRDSFVDYWYHWKFSTQIFYKNNIKPFPFTFICTSSVLV